MVLIQQRSVRGSARGFTIVELLIVVVVIAILAAITIVAYSGISNRAKNSAAASAAQQASKKIMSHAVTNSDLYPATLNEAGVIDGSATYQYRYDNSANPKTYCVTATANNVSYFQSHTSVVPVAGACSGHGANGAATTANLVMNPKVATTLNGWLVHFVDGGSLTQSGPLTGGYNGNNYSRFTVTTVPTTSSFSVGFGRPDIAMPVSVTAGQPYVWSMWVRSNKALGPVSLRVRFMSGTTAIADSYGSSTTLAVNTWTRLSFSGNTPAGSDNGRILFYATSASPALQLSDTLDVTMAMVSPGSTLGTYADGDSSGWAWDGAANNSPSAGPQ